MAARKKRLQPFTDPELRELEAAAPGDNPLGETIQRVLLSYKITARVANAAWKLAEKMDVSNTATWLHPLIYELEKALHDYSPGNWPLPRGEKEHCAQVLEQLYEEASQLPTREAILEKIYETTVKEHEEGSQ